MKLCALRQFGVAAAAATGMFFSATAALAAGSVQWTSPPDGSTFLEGTVVHPTGNATGFATGGAGLDLALVLDASGSMSSNATSGGVTQTRLKWQADAAIALVNSLPTANTAVAVVQYSSVANSSVRLELTPTTSAQDIIDAINAVPASGLTATGTGIQLAEGELNERGVSGRSQQMVVISDGAWNTGPNPVTAAGAANTDSGIIVHGVVIPGGSPTQMQNIANAGGGSFFDARTDQGLQDLIALFSGTGGTLVGVDKVEVKLPDGTIIPNALTDAFGNFKVPAPGYALALGPNVFTATAFFSDGTQLSADLTLNATPIPLPAAAWLLLGGLGGLGLIGRKRRAA
ncbi:MAG: VWA domain-containing protein [Rhodobacteraceae bacterium]|nr:MAG: VWA domain-containing protein [Paracoccaceae bacterium]